MLKNNNIVIIITLLICIFSFHKGLGQSVPKLNYSSPFSLTLNTKINAINPNNSGGAIGAFTYQLTNTIAGIRGKTGHDDGPLGTATFNGPKGVAVDKSGNIFVADSGNNSIRKITPDGAVSTFAGSITGASGFQDGQGSAALFNQPIGLAIDNNNNLFVADKGNNSIREIDQTGNVTTYAGNGAPGSTNGPALKIATFNQPVALAIDPSMNIYVADMGNNLIRRINSVNRIVVTLAGIAGVSGHNNNNTNGSSPATFNQPKGLTYEASTKNIYVVDYGNNLIRQITSQGVVTTLSGKLTAGSAEGSGKDGVAQFNFPTSLVSDLGGIVYVADFKNNKIRSILSTYFGNTSTYAGSGLAGYDDGIGTNAEFNEPYGITTDQYGNLIISDFGNNTIRRVSTNGYTLGGTLPIGLNFDPTTGIISGTPAKNQKLSNYTITGYNSYGKSSQQISISVVSSSNDFLSSLSTSVGSLSPSFSSTTYNYNIAIPNDVDGISFTPSLVDSNATLRINGNINKSGKITQPFLIDYGDNYFDLVVLAQDGNTQNTYHIDVNRAYSKIATLSNIALSSGTINPIFNSTNYIYTDSLDNNTSQLAITPTLTDPNAVIIINDNYVTSGTPAVLDISVGNNLIPITVYAQDNITTQTYNLSVYRAPSAIATLRSLAINSGNLIPKFDTSINNYVDSVTYATTSISLTPTLTDSTATLTINGVVVANAKSSSNIPLDVGNNFIGIIITAQDGKKINYYSLTINRDRGKQTITFQPYPTTTYGDPDLSPRATVTSGLPINYSSSDTTVATILNNKIHILSAGSAIITARVSADKNFYPINSINQLLLIKKADQKIQNTSIPAILNIGQNFDLSSISSTSNLPLSFSISDTTIAVIRNRKIIPLEIGEINLIVTQSGNKNFNDVTQTTGIAIQEINQNEIKVHQFVSPNGDGYNDFLLIEGIQEFTNNSVKLINRDGIIVFNTRGYDNEKVRFDGHSSNNSSYLPEGTYFYIIEYTNKAGESRRKTDFIVLKY